MVRPSSRFYGAFIYYLYNFALSLLLISVDKFQSAAMEISKEFGLSIFGFDVIIPESSETSEIYVVDINYFPSFKEVENFPEKLNKFLITRASQNFTS